jgi:hypothetical protein
MRGLLIGTTILLNVNENETGTADGEKQVKTTHLLEDRYYSLMRVRFKDL